MRTSRAIIATRPTRSAPKSFVQSLPHAEPQHMIAANLPRPDSGRFDAAAVMPCCSRWSNSPGFTVNEPYSRCNRVVFLNNRSSTPRHHHHGSLHRAATEGSDDTTREWRRLTGLSDFFMTPPEDTHAWTGALGWTGTRRVPARCPKLVLRLLWHTRSNPLSIHSAVQTIDYSAQNDQDMHVHVNHTVFSSPAALARPSSHLDSYRKLN